MGSFAWCVSPLSLSSAHPFTTHFPSIASHRTSSHGPKQTQRTDDLAISHAPLLLCTSPHFALAYLALRGDPARTREMWHALLGGVVLAQEEGENIAQALGPKRNTCILQNHGLMTRKYAR